jgi:TetR/AcrR family transcriptional regulator, transcriptional repressor for nem operon
MGTAEHVTRTALLDAGVALASLRSLHQLSVNDLVKQAGVAKGTFYVHFADRTSYLVALHRRFHDELWTRISTATSTLPPGPERLHRSITAYLDGCLDQPATRAILFDAHSEPALRDHVNGRNTQSIKVLSIDLRASGIARPSEKAHLVVAMTVEIALSESRAGRRLGALRSALFEFVAASPT